MPEPIADVAAALALGRRERQEDVVATRFADDIGAGFAVLSDGMGGHDDGDLAARVIVSTLSGAFAETGEVVALDQSQLRWRLLEGVQAANRGLRHRVEDGSGQEGMGGTVVAAVLRDRRLSWVSVGDSSLHLFRDGRLSRLNQDHSFGPQIDLLVARGMMDAETARTHPQRGCLTSALVGAQIASIDCPAEPVTLRHGDILLMASDGLVALEKAEVAEILEAHCALSSEEIAQALLDAVAQVDDPHQDNVSVIVIKPRLPRFGALAQMRRAVATVPLVGWLGAGVAQRQAARAARVSRRLAR